MTDFYGPHDGSGFVTPVSSGNRPLGVERVKERFIAPDSVPSTGEVRSQAAVNAAMTPSVAQDQGLSGTRTWSPPV